MQRGPASVGRLVISFSLIAAAGCMPASSQSPGAGGSSGQGGTTPTAGSGGSTGGQSGRGGASNTAGSGGSGGGGETGASPQSGAGGGGATGGSAGGSTGGTPAADGRTAADTAGGADVPTSSGTVTDPGTAGDGDVTMTGPYNYPPEATMQPGVTAGKLVDVPVQATVFPGANRAVQVYIPNGYVAGQPAPFMVLQDGPSYVSRFKLPIVLDNMIAKQQLPLMLAIFVPNAGARRSVEYDTLSDAYVRFVLEDVLPAVEKGAPVKLTTDPEGRGAGGHSSGGIAAFTMGWHRPDQFRRILTHSGSFVSIRGGDKYPGIVKATPMKPLRVFLSVGSKDNEAPRWQRGNEGMAGALKQQGYHYRFVLQQDGTHAQTYPAAILPETLLWLWRGYPIAGK